MMGIESQFTNLFCIEAIFKNYRASFAKKEVLSNQITEINEVLKSSITAEEKQLRIFTVFRKESPLLKAINILVKLGKSKFVDFASSLLKPMLKSFAHTKPNQSIDRIEVYQGLYIQDELLDSIDKYFVKNEYMFFNDVS